ncbi:MAG: DUF5009 domain-containing protein [Muribaculaceae bacterium]|nr:DUF5009 domain-containing protein [Muribaculaceae bacterium]
MANPIITHSGSPPPHGGRLLALDILRGITIAGMILVNNPGSWADTYAPLRHAEWNGLTPTDLVFPFFMFIMGISTYFSLRKYDFRLTLQSFGKIARRTALIFLLGVALAWFYLFIRGTLSGATLREAVFTFDRIRIMGVLPRLALSYGFGALLALLIPRRALPWTVAALLGVYAVMLVAGHGYEFSERNIIYVVDSAILGKAHLYVDLVGGERVALDPEGLTGTLPSVAHVLIGFICGGLISGTKDNTLRVNRLFIVGTVLTFAGFLLSYGLPMNKKIWSPTFVLTTCGLAASLLALLIWIIDIRGYRRWSRFFEVFGVNPLFLFCISGIIATILGTLRISSQTAPDGFVTLKGLIYNSLIAPLSFGNPALASLLWALLFITLNWLIGLPLYRKKIYIKI